MGDYARANFQAVFEIVISAYCIVVFTLENEIISSAQRLLPRENDIDLIDINAEAVRVAVINSHAAFALVVTRLYH